MSDIETQADFVDFAEAPQPSAAPAEGSSSANVPGNGAKVDVPPRVSIQTLPKAPEQQVQKPHSYSLRSGTKLTVPTPPSLPKDVNPRKGEHSPSKDDGSSKKGVNPSEGLHRGPGAQRGKKGKGRATSGQDPVQPSSRSSSGSQKKTRGRTCPPPKEGQPSKHCGLEEVKHQEGGRGDISKDSTHACTKDGVQLDRQLPTTANDSRGLTTSSAPGSQHILYPSKAVMIETAKRRNNMLKSPPITVAPSEVADGYVEYEDHTHSEIYLQNIEDRIFEYLQGVTNIMNELKSQNKQLFDNFCGLQNNLNILSQDMTSVKDDITGLTSSNIDLALANSNNFQELGQRIDIGINTLTTHMKEKDEQQGNITSLLVTKLSTLQLGIENLHEKIMPFIRAEGPSVTPSIPTQQETRSKNVSKGIVPETRELPPHMYHNPVLEEHYEDIKEEASVVDKSIPPSSGIEERVTMYKDKVYYPNTPDDPSFEGIPDEDWCYFIEIIDTLQNAYNLPDAEITSRLPLILTGIARVWYRITCKSNMGASWMKWKELIQKKFNTSSWRIKQLVLLEKEKYSYAVKDTLEFLLTLHRRIQAIYPDSSREEQIHHMLMRLPNELHAVIKTSCRDVTDISEFIALCEEILDASWGRKNALVRIENSYEKTNDRNSNKRILERKKPVTVPLHGSSHDLKPKDKRTCYKCKAPWTEGHRCRATKINLVEDDKEESEDESNISIGEEDLAYNSQSDINMLEVNNSRKDNTEVLVNLVSHQDNTQDAVKIEASELPPQSFCPARCIGLVNNNNSTIIMDTGAAGSVVSCKYLQDIDPDWETKISETNMGAWKGYGSNLMPRGTYATNVVFCNPRGNLR